MLRRVRPRLCEVTKRNDNAIQIKSNTDLRVVSAANPLPPAPISHQIFRREYAWNLTKPLRSKEFISGHYGTRWKWKNNAISSAAVACFFPFVGSYVAALIAAASAVRFFATALTIPTLVLKLRLCEYAPGDPAIRAASSGVPTDIARDYHALAPSLQPSTQLIEGALKPQLPSVLPVDPLTPVVFSNPKSRFQEENKVIESFTHLEILAAAPDWLGYTFKRIDLADIEELGQDEEGTYVNMRIKGLNFPLQLELGRKFDAAVPSILKANPQLQIVPVKLKFWWFPIFGLLPYVTDVERLQELQEAKAAALLQQDTGALPEQKKPELAN
eukprot:TRINITY_DN29233_c0_g1_i1.p1 TRINITY_DN29233_c0_g1~~TRINITY_DN29233_c0_g1_i1.p1  ORF type:complete len:329 (-),score=49.07 TRINITY_DN29233_c0_g1_i1:45-1031(-)